MKIYIMRHCERDINNCSFESPLLDIGHINAQQSCVTMQYLNITKIYSSPFLRTIQTSHYYSKEHNIPINIDYSLCEFVDSTDKHKMYSSNNYIIPQEWKNTYNINTTHMIKNTFGNDESINICITRVNSFLEYIKKTYENSDENILLVTHMSIVNILLAITNKTINDNFDFDKYYPMGLITKL